jgi:putative ABC transport system substrate-binding protein
MRRVGWLTSFAADDPVPQAYIAALLQGLQELGWSVGRNVRIDYRWGAANAELKSRYAVQLQFDRNVCSCAGFRTPATTT